MNPQPMKAGNGLESKLRGRCTELQRGMESQKPLCLQRGEGKPKHAAEDPTDGKEKVTKCFDRLAHELILEGVNRESVTALC